MQLLDDSVQQTHEAANMERQHREMVTHIRSVQVNTGNIPSKYIYIYIYIYI
jgi:hypothetical protein